jgi:hypothetical protein
MVKWIHKKEKELYKFVYSVSHTNDSRMQMFLNDNQLSLTGKTQILPNYPPRKWIITREGPKSDLPLKIVYVGIIGMESLYIQKFCEWVHNQTGKVVFDIYSQQNTKELQDWILEDGVRFTEIKGYIPYDEMPGILSKYDVGVILYKGHIPNYVYNAPNKLFEYWACGLDVWFSENITGCLPYARYNVLPRILPVNFQKLSQLNPDSAKDSEGIKFEPSDYYCEKVLDQYFASIIGNNIKSIT